MPPRVAKNIAISLGVVLIVLGLAGFTPNPFVGKEALLETDFWQNVGHAVIGVYLVGMALTGEGNAAFGLYSSALACILFAGNCYMELGNWSKGYAFNHAVEITKGSVWFHASLGAILGVAGTMNTAKRQLFYQ